jgi:ATP-dependent DNA helicase RecG
MSWTSEDLNIELQALRERGGDSALVEAKAASGGVPSLSETLCAFGNMPDGGTILLGVDESAGFAITGVADVAAMESGVAAQARTSVSPPVQVSFDVVDAEGRQVLVVTVTGLPAAAKPCRTRGKAYLRQADGDYAMSEQEVTQLTDMQDRPRYDSALMPGSSVSDLDAGLVASFVQAARASSRRLAEATDEEILHLKGVARGGTLTVAGLYGLGNYPQQFAPSLAVTAAAVSPGGDSRLADLAHFDGPLADLLDLSVDWVARNTRSGVAYRADGHAYNQPEIPLVTVRELVANALVHRDLSPRTQSKRVEIRLLPDRLVVASPGGLWGVSRDQLGSPSGKSAVNEFLYDIARLVSTRNGRRLIEGEGGGIREAQEALHQADLRPAQFVDTGVSFTALVFRPGASEPHPPAQPLQTNAAVPVGITANAAAVWAELQHGQQGTSSLAAHTALTRRQVKYALDALAARGLVEVQGGRGNRNTIYRIALPA